MKSGRRQMRGVLAVAWFNLAIMPCAMAFGAADHCPHSSSPNEQQSAQHDHHHHSAQPASAQATLESSDCASMQPDCCDLEDAVVEGRSCKVKNPDSVSLVGALSNYSSLQTERAVQHETKPPEPRSDSPPRHKLYCVYLD